MPKAKQWNYEGSTVPEPFVRLAREDGLRGAIVCPVCNQANGSLHNGKCYECWQPKGDMAV